MGLKKKEIMFGLSEQISLRGIQGLIEDRYLLDEEQWKKGAYADFWEARYMAESVYANFRGLV